LTRSTEKTGLATGRLLQLLSTRTQTISLWTISLHQATDMLKSWTSCNISGRISIAKDTRTLSLNVLAGTGFQRDYKFTASFETATDEEPSYREALAIVLDNALFMMLVPLNVLLMPLVPASWARIGQATEEFRGYMTNLLKEERRLLDFDLPSSGNLISSLVRASEEEKRRRNGSVDRRKGLQMSEILGNIFVINFAGLLQTLWHTASFSLQQILKFRSGYGKNCKVFYVGIPRNGIIASTIPS
jgi:cytochrome P450